LLRPPALAGVHGDGLPHELALAQFAIEPDGRLQQRISKVLL
jgi:hypothetical protein